MRHYRDELVKTHVTKVLDRVQCDDCGKEYGPKGVAPRHFAHTFGYGTDYDGDTYEADICDECLKTNPYWRRIWRFVHGRFGEWVTPEQPPVGASMDEMDAYIARTLKRLHDEAEAHELRAQQEGRRNDL